MGHVKQKKSTSSSTSTPPENAGIELKESVPHSSSRRSYPEQLNVEELISQINCRIDATNDSNNNRSRNNNPTTHQDSNHQSRSGSVEDVENGPSPRHRRQKPLFRRLITFIRNLWIGAKFNVGNDGKKRRHYKKAFQCSKRYLRFNYKKI